MPDYSRIAALVRSSVWLIEPKRGNVIAEQFLNRIEAGAASPENFLTEAELEENRMNARVRMVPMPPSGKNQISKNIAIMPLMGAILPRGDTMADMSGGGAVSLVRFQQEFKAAAADQTVGAIVLEIDSPGGQVDMVPETAALIASQRKAGRPIIAVANTLAASAAYWLAAAADEIVVTPSGSVGSVGVFMLHQDVSQQAAAMGVVPTYIYEGVRKVDGNPFEPLSDRARETLQESVRMAYDQFAGAVAEYRGVKKSVVQADPAKSAQHFGGGDAYTAGALKAKRLLGKGGMADRVDTMDGVIQRLMGRGPVSRRTNLTKAKLALD